MFFSALAVAALLSAESAKIYEPGNLVAWCVVPFDAKKRGPAERAEMLQRLGFKKFAYDWRAEHLPTFEQEVIELKKRDIELTAVWFPAVMNADAKSLLAVIEKHKLTPQLWVMVPEPTEVKDYQKFEAAVKALTPVFDAAEKAGCLVSLYNHGGWAGEPGNLGMLVYTAKRTHVGLVYNLHHGHADLPKLTEPSKWTWGKIHAINLSGMHANGDLTGRKIEVLGEGPEDLPILRAIRASGYVGPIGILGHTDDDAEDRLADNLAGLARLRAMIAGEPGLPHRGFRSHRPDSTHSTPEFAVAADRRSITYGPGGGGPMSVTLDGDPRPLEAEPRLEAVPKEEFVRYTPRYKLTVGTPLRVTVGGKSQRLVVPPDRRPATPTVVEKVSGLPDQVPENALRFYLHFSRPMTRGEGLKHVHLANKDGDPVEDAFLDLAEELWSPDGRRLTVFFDPARVKRELVPREQLGPILEVGRGYRLTVGAAWPDENGHPLSAAFTKDFTAVRADEEPIDPAKWKVEVDDDRSWMTVTFEKPLDAALAGRMIRVVTADGAEVEGYGFGYEKRWMFSFKVKSLPLGDYSVRVDSRLEDPCGNRVGRAFELDARKPNDDAPDYTDLPFTMK